MGRHPKQEPRKEYLENAQTTWIVSSPADFAEVFPKGDKASREVDLIPATKGTRLAKGTFRIVLHLPNKKYNDRETYLSNPKKMKPLKMIDVISIGRYNFLGLTFLYIKYKSLGLVIK